METKANYKKVGLFVVVFLGVFLAFILWITNIGIGPRKKDYDIYFSGSVSGLKEGSAVNFRGVPIGGVKSIEIDEENTDQIKVHVLIDAQVAIRKTMVASLEMQGITGGAYVQINGGNQADPLLNQEVGNDYPVIPSRPSLLEEVTGSVPQLINKVSAITDTLGRWFAEDNRRSFSEILSNIQSITESFDPNNKEGHELMVSLHNAADNLNKTLQELSGVSHEIRKILDENRKGLQEFSGSGLTAFTRFLQEGQETFSTFRRIGESIERSPTRFLHNDSSQGVRLK